MVRVKRGTIKNKRKNNLLKRAKGYRFGRSTKFKQAKEAVIHAATHAFKHRKEKKRNFKRLWHTQINAALHPLGLSYSKFMGQLKKQNVGINRKTLAEIAQDNPESFKRIVEKVQG